MLQILYHTFIVIIDLFRQCLTNYFVIELSLLCLHDNKTLHFLNRQLSNYFVAAGLKSGGSNAAGGIGSMLANWIVNGASPMDAYDLDILRFLPAHNNRRFLLDRVREVPGKCCVLFVTVSKEHYKNIHPFSLSFILFKY